jgi:sec-independent protein translocase protein TatC
VEFADWFTAELPPHPERHSRSFHDSGQLPAYSSVQGGPEARPIMPYSHRHTYDEDFFADTRMTFGEHIEDLRTHLFRALYGFLIALAISFVPGWTVLRLIAEPVEKEMQRFYDERARRVAAGLREGNPELTALNQVKEQTVELPLGELAKALGLAPPEGTPSDRWVEIRMRIRPVDMAVDLAKGMQLVNRRPGLSTLSPVEAFMAYIKVCFVCGLVLGSPWIFYQVWSFIAAGLYPHEKKLVNLYLPISLGLFLTGVLVCQFLVIPKALEALLWFNYWLDLEPDLRFNEWLGFAILLPVLFGFSFQLPMLMMALDRLGIFTLETYKRKWRMSVFLLFAFAALLPTVDAFSMMSLGVAMCGLYGLGILLCWFNPRAKESDIEPSDSGQAVEA